MGKLRIRKAVSKRFKVTKTGKVLHGQQNRSHLKTNKTKRALRRLKTPAELAKPFAKKVKIMLGEA